MIPADHYLVWVVPEESEGPRWGHWECICGEEFGDVLEEGWIHLGSRIV